MFSGCYPTAGPREARFLASGDYKRQGSSASAGQALAHGYLRSKGGDVKSLGGYGQRQGKAAGSRRY